MAGRVGRNRAWNKLTPEMHLARGTFRKDRHGRRALPVKFPVTTDPETVPERLLEGLTGPGRAFIEQCWSTYSGWTPPTLTLLREAGMLLDQLEPLRGQRGERLAQRTLLAVLAQLRLDP